MIYHLEGLLKLYISVRKKVWKKSFLGGLNPLLLSSSISRKL
jgi:hypothetical protein